MNFRKNLIGLSVIGFVLFASVPAHAKIGIGIGGGGSWLRGPITTSGSLTPYIDFELGIVDSREKSAVGPFLQMNFARGTAAANTNPLFYGLFVRLFLDKKNVLFLDLKIDPLGLVYGVLLSGSASGGASQFFNYLNWQHGLGFNFKIGKVFALQPYFAYRSFTHPYLSPSLSAQTNRFYSPDVGLRLSIVL